MGARRTVEIDTALPLSRITGPQLEHAVKLALDRPVVKGRKLVLGTTLRDMERQISRRNKGRGRGRIR